MGYAHPWLLPTAMQPYSSTSSSTCDPGGGGGRVCRGVAERVWVFVCVVCRGAIEHIPLGFFF